MNTTQVLEQNPTREVTFFARMLRVLVAFNALLYPIFIIDFALNPFSNSPFGYGSTNSPAFRALCALVFAPSTLIVGFVIVRRAVGNVIGYLLMLWGFGLASFGLSTTLNPYVFALICTMIPTWWISLFLIPVFYPNGKAYPRRLEVLFVAVIVFGVLQGVLSVLGSPDPRLPGTANVMYLPVFSGVQDVFRSIGNLLFLPVFLSVLITPFLRYRRADYRQRQQLKWLALSALILIPFLVTYGILTAETGNYSRQPNVNPLVVSVFFTIYYTFVGLFPTLTIGNAILRHRLYDIDIIIRRTLIYGVLTGVLAAAYFGAIILTQQVFRAATGETSDLGIVLSTLLIAALFTPVRRRVQEVIDRRLYRRKYDVEKTLADFQRNLREDVDMDTLQANLVGVVSDTMQPSKIALWVKGN